MSRKTFFFLKKIGPLICKSLLECRVFADYVSARAFIMQYVMKLTSGMLLQELDVLHAALFSMLNPDK